jgi:hypothetical protein
MVFKSLHRSSQWKNEESLYRSGLKICPKNAKIYYNIAKLLQTTDTNVINKYHKVKSNEVGNILKSTSVDWESFQNELRLSVTKTDYHLKYPDSSVVILYKTAIRLWPRYEHALNNLANVLRKRNEKQFHLEANHFL